MPEENTTNVTLKLYRCGKDVKTGFERGELHVLRNGLLYKIYSTRERGADTVSLRIGDYTMKHSTKITGRNVRCLRPTEFKISTILIHDAFEDDPNELEGCVAPGIRSMEADWSNSARAMDELWTDLGGWDETGTVQLRVVTNVSYAPRNQTRNEWGRL